MTEHSADHRLSEKIKAHTVLAQYSFDLRRRLWNTILWHYLKDRDVAGGTKWFVYRRHFLPSHNLRWFASTPPIRIFIEQLADNQSEYPMTSNPPTANTLRLCKFNLTRHRPHGSKSFQLSWTHPTDFRNVSDVLRLGRCVPAFRCLTDRQMKNNNRCILAEFIVYLTRGV